MVILTSSIFLSRVCTKKSTEEAKGSCLVGMNQCGSGYFCKPSPGCLTGPGDLCHG